MDDLVDAFEAAYAREGHAEIAEFLPEPGHPDYLLVLRELVRIEIERNWTQNKQRRLDDYRSEFPELFADLASLAEVAFEEYRARRLAGEQPSPDEYQRRYGVCTHDCPSGNEGSADESRSGSDSVEEAAHAAESLGFELLAELGRGAFGRVFLARQGDLANRLVVLKVSPDVAIESHRLAQLQHTNVVPIYSVHRSGRFQAVCMPYFGSHTLANVLSNIRSHASLPVSGRELLSTLDNRKAATVNSQTQPPTEPPAKPTGGDSALAPPSTGSNPQTVGRSMATIEMLDRLGYVEAVIWLGARLADGLAHAHDRGILHRDLKPANILLTDEGQPMLLDFNLAADVKLRVAEAAAHMGGTLPYMAPEHLEALQDGHRPVDSRSDLYSLGIILFELLTGRQPFGVYRGPLEMVLPKLLADRRAAAPELRRWNRAVSPAVESIIRRCLNPDPDRRYQSARELHEDLELHLAHRLLRHAPNPSIGERARKFLRRHSRLTSATAIATVALAAVLGLSAVVVLRERHVARLEAAESFRQLERKLRDAQTLLNGVDPNRTRVESGIALCREILDRYDVTENADWMSRRAVQSLPHADRQRLNDGLGETLRLLARGVAEIGSVDEALRFNTRAESCFLPDEIPRALWLQRAELAIQSGNEVEAELLAARAVATPIRTARDRYLAGSEAVARGQFHDAFSLLVEASRQESRDFAVWFLRGNCHAGLGQFADAAACFSTCTALAPDSHWAYFHRGLAAIDAQRFDEAATDFDRAIELRPDLAESYVNRGVAHFRGGNFAGAVADYSQAIALGTTETRVYFMRGRARSEVNDLDGAACDHEEGLRREPTDEMSWIARGLARLADDAAGALADFGWALQLNPRSREALQNSAHVLSERLGRSDEAIAMLDRAIELHSGFVLPRAGRGVLLARQGHRNAALADARQALEIDRQPSTLYQVAGIYALTSRQTPDDRREALRLLASALAQDPTWFTVIPNDPDLDPIRNDPDFARLLETFRDIDAVPPGVQR